MRDMNLYSANTKIADIVFSNPALLSVLERLKIELGFGEATVAQICNRYNLSQELFLDICNIYTHKEYEPQTSNLSKSDLIRLIDYLHTSHRFYQKKSFPKIHKQIHKLLENNDISNKKILNKFYDDYDAEVIKHFEYEEKTVFPYVRNLVIGKRTKNKMLKIDQFEENHSNIEEKLKDLKSIILKYLPASYSQTIRISLLNDIFQLESDMLCHTRIEDKLLIPLVQRAEQNR